MFRTVLFSLAVWSVVSVPAALLLGRFMALGSATDRLDSALAHDHDQQVPKAA